MGQTELAVTWTDAWTGVVAGVGVYVAVILLTRLFTQRALTSMASFDYPVTVAIGAIVGRTALVHTSLAGGAIALLTLFTAQAALGFARYRLGIGPLIDSPSRVLVVDGELNPRHLRAAHLDRADIFEKLRLSGVTRLEQVRLMVHERGGGISVLAGDGPIDPELLRDVVDEATQERLSRPRH